MGEFVMHRLFPIVCNMSLTASVVILAAAAVVMAVAVYGWMFRKTSAAYISALPVTPEALAAVLSAEGVHDILYINKVESAEARQLARRVTQLVATPVVAGSLRRGEFACLR